jgi:hypothetical protein
MFISLCSFTVDSPPPSKFHKFWTLNKRLYWSSLTYNENNFNTLSYNNNLNIVGITEIKRIVILKKLLILSKKKMKIYVLILLFIKM